MRHRSVYLFILSILLYAFSTASAGDMQTLEKNAPPDSDVKRVNLEADIGVAEFSLTTHDGGDIYTVTARYDAEETDVTVEFDKSGSSADLFLSSEQIDDDLDIDTDDVTWDISLSRDYSWDIQLDLGVTDADIDLSGLPVEALKIDHGVSECRVIFTEPNPIEMRRLVVDAGVGDVKIGGIGHANAGDMYFDGGTGDFVLNFSGQKKDFRTAQIDVGVGSVTVEVPRDLPVRIETEEGWLNSVSVPKRHFVEVGDDVYETDAYDKAEYGLAVELDVGIGSATVKLRE